MVILESQGKGMKAEKGTGVFQLYLLRLAQMESWSRFQERMEARHDGTCL